MLRHALVASPSAWWRLGPLLLLGRLSLCAVRKEDIAQIKCQVCEIAITEAHALSAEQVAAHKLDRKSEDALTDFVDNLCRQGRREGRWLRRLDVQNIDGDTRLRVENMTEFGVCKAECNLARAACAAALQGKEEQLVSLIAEDAPLKKMKSRACKKTCSKAPPPLKTPRKDESFEKGEDAGLLEMLENRDKLREETGQILEIQRRDEIDQMSDADREAMAAQDAFAEQMREAREMSGRDWKGRELDDL
mmetsp:Transcript_50373/g.79855  ORF Transcript_50373/g.79855 Transcript_50373/m.79855 type:complete len:249 (+) Transcript_50373:30-776(+)